MKFLAIDTSGGEVLVAAANENRESVRRVVGTTSVRLMDEIDGVLSDVGLKKTALDFIACVVGPGSFTGIRIGISTAKGLCFALDKPALALTSFDLLAYAETGKSLALIDAGHGNYYACAYENGIALAPAFLSEEELAHYRDEGYTFLSRKPLLVECNIKDAGAGLLGAAKANADGAGKGELTALYLRKSSAEEGR